MADVFKRVLVYMAKRNKRGTRVYISRASCPQVKGAGRLRVRVTLKEQKRNKRHSRGRAGAHKRNNKGTEDVQQGYKR